MGFVVGFRFHEVKAIGAGGGGRVFSGWFGDFAGFSSAEGPGGDGGAVFRPGAHGWSAAEEVDGRLLGGLGCFQVYWHDISAV